MKRVVRAPSSNLERNRAPSVGDHQLERRKIFQDSRPVDGNYRKRFLGRKMLVIDLAPVVATGGMDVRRNVHLHQLVPQRIPVLTSEVRRLAIAFAGIGIQQYTNEAQFVDAAIDFLETSVDTFARHLRQSGDTAKPRRMHLYRARDGVIVGAHPHMNDAGRLGGMIQLERAWRQELHISPHAVHYLQV